ncbi:hypothetical protein HOLleu_42088 [Holothuria leucospilota]|uniref:Ig-like domain-containing protein n=1 Tax=Holothuria leucospilota TaxID=206669 RepID=A0A9Q0YAS6_HOLLE|nr:hypothetical protein HOLleu_42088 [Holothuria leucospilota]
MLVWLLWVKPKVAFPVINYCGNVSNNCFSKVNAPLVECTVQGVRPNISLDLVVRTSEGDKNIPGQTTITQEGISYTFRVTARNVFYYTDLLALLICKASSKTKLLANDKSIILIQNGAVDISLREATLNRVERGTKLEITCANDDVGFLVWKKKSLLSDGLGGQEKVLLYANFIGEQVTEVVQSDVILGINGSLVIPTVDVQHEGRYTCVYGDGMSDDVRVYGVVVIVHPVPTYLVVNGCDPHQYCVLEGGHQGSIQCTVNRIRPLTDLQWKTFYDSDATAISFTNQQLTVKDNGDTFDVTLTSTYTVKDKSRDRITIECSLKEEDGPLFELTTKLDLIFVEGNIPPTKQVDLPTTGSILIWVIPVIVVLLLLVLLFGLLIQKFLCKLPVENRLLKMTL